MVVLQPPSYTRGDSVLSPCWVAGVSPRYEDLSRRLQVRRRQLVGRLQAGVGEPGPRAPARPGGAGGASPLGPGGRASDRGTRRSDPGRTKDEAALLELDQPVNALDPGEVAVGGEGRADLQLLQQCERGAVGERQPRSVGREAAKPAQRGGACSSGTLPKSRLTSWSGARSRPKP